MRQPSAIVHMGWAGTWMGTMLGGVYGAMFIFGIMMLDGFQYFEGDIFIAVSGMGALVGAGFGLPMGLLIGFILRVAIRRHEMPLRAADLQRLKRSGQIACFVAGLGAFGFILAWVEGNFQVDGLTLIVVIVPLCIAFFASVRAMNRYLKKLDTFMSGKNKAKREAA